MLGLLVLLVAFCVVRLIATLPLLGFFNAGEAGRAPIPSNIESTKVLEIPQPDAALRAPLFDPNRRSLATSTPEPTGGPLSKYRLEGVILSRGNRIAHVSEAGVRTIHKLKEGQTFNGFIVNEIKEDRVVFLIKGSRAELSLAPPGGDSANRSLIPQCGKQIAVPVLQ